MTPVHLQWIDALTNFRRFTEPPLILTPFAKSAPDRGQWIVLTGAAGSGKTTLLQAIALTLASPFVASKLLDSCESFLRDGVEGRVRLTLNTANLGARIVRRDRVEVVLPADDEVGARPWVVGYGAYRGNGSSRRELKAELGPIGDLHTLFGQPSALVNTIAWLKVLDRQRLRTPLQREALWRVVESVLTTVLGITSLEPAAETIFVRDSQFGRMRFDELSDGHLSTAAWVIDLIARWIDRQRELGGGGAGADFLREMTGVVLIDEIDLHLCAAHKLTLLKKIRALFPRLSFIVTAHSSTVLHSTQIGEAFVVRRDARRMELVAYE